MLSKFVAAKSLPDPAAFSVLEALAMPVIQTQLTGQEMVIFQNLFLF